MSGMPALRVEGNKSMRKQVWCLPIVSVVAVLLTGCGLPAERNVRAYDACMSRHPQEAALCEGPREAYEVDTSIYQARATDHPAAALPAPMPPPLRPNPVPVTPGPNG
jgi:hypothetical protein